MRETERGENAMNVIVAVDENWGIGKDGDQLVYLSQDLKRFKALTTGHPVILGRKTLATFPGGRPLKGRRNLILSRDPAFAQEGAEVFRDLEALRSAVSEDAFVIGGASVYEQLLPWCDTAYVTRIHAASPIWTGIPIGNWRRRSRPWSRMACSSTMCATGGYVDGRPGEWGDIITMSGETCFRKNTVRPAFVDAGRTVFQNMACFLRFSSASGRFDRIAPTVGQVSSSGQLPQVAAPRFKAHWRMPQRWSQNTVLTPSVQQPWQLICSGRMGALFNSAHSFAVLSRRAWSLWSVARYASHEAQFSPQ